MAKSPESTSGLIFWVATSTTKRCAPVPSRKLEKAMLFPSGAQDGSRLMEAPVSGCGANPSHSEVTICLPASL